MISVNFVMCVKILIIIRHLKRNEKILCRNFFSNLPQVQKIPNLAYQIYQTLQIYLVYEKDYIKYKYDRK